MRMSIHNLLPTASRPASRGSCWHTARHQPFTFVRSRKSRAAQPSYVIRNGVRVSAKLSPRPRRSELDEDSEEERKRALAASKQQAAFVDVQTMDDEVERVLGWRCAS